jgi:hypothetical protein
MLSSRIMPGARWSRRAVLAGGLTWSAEVAGAGRVSFTQLRRVFEAQRSTVVRVIAPTEPPVLGVLIGARGETLLFGADTAPTIRLRRGDGQTADATRLGGVEGWPLRLVRWPEDVAPASPGLAFPGAFARVLRIGWGPGGPEPALGSVSTPPSADGTALVDVPGIPGAPLFDGAGRLIGIGLDRRKRRSRVATLSAIAPRLAPWMAS